MVAFTGARRGASGKRSTPHWRERKAAAGASSPACNEGARVGKRERKRGDVLVFFDGSETGGVTVAMRWRRAAESAHL